MNLCLSEWLVAPQEGHGVRSLPLDLRLQCCDEWLYKTLCVSATFHRVPVYPSHSLTLFVCCKALLMHYHSWSATRSPLQTVWRGGLPCWVHANRTSNVAVRVNVSRLANCMWRELCPTVTWHMTYKIHESFRNLILEFVTKNAFTTFWEVQMFGSDHSLWRGGGDSGSYTRKIKLNILIKVLP
jgi:hypothetical protein